MYRADEEIQPSIGTEGALIDGDSMGPLKLIPPDLILEGTSSYLLKSPSPESAFANSSIPCMGCA